jgi:hypothetical protein
VLIGLGIIFLLNNLELWDLRRALRYWPALMIVVGVYMLYARYAAGNSPAAPASLEKDQ